jgi:CDGSH-type Zn-finger protein
MPGSDAAFLKANPFCSGAHKTTNFKPLVWQAAEAKEAWLSRCKHTKKPAYCDGTRKTV